MSDTNKCVQGSLFPELDVVQTSSSAIGKKKSAADKLREKISLLQEEIQTKQQEIEQLKTTVQSKDQTIAELQNTNQKLKVKAEAFDSLVASHSLFTTSVIAKSFGRSAIWLNDYLHKKKVQYKKGDVWLLYAQYDKCDYTRICWYNYNTDSKGNPLSKATSYWTGKGLLFIRDLLKKDGLLRD
ncbi:MAG: phage antirepressor KilAC domain-containing protein [Alphaproteobacteria bacterium]